MATRKGIDISGHHLVRQRFYAFFINVLRILKK